MLLHGLARTHRSMLPVARALEARGYRTVTVSYRSRRHPIDQLAPMAVQSGLSRCPRRRESPLRHPLAGRHSRPQVPLAEQPIPRLGRVVMLAPPNQGSEVVDAMRRVPGFWLLNGPAGLQLGTDPASVPRNLPRVDFELGVVAGTRSVNLILSRFLPKPDDGKVSVASTRVEGMTDHVTVAHSHPLIMRSMRVHELVASFLERGVFAR